MPPFLIPLISALGTGLVGLILRYMEQKIFKLDAEKTAKAITRAKLSTTHDNPSATMANLLEAQEHNDNILKNASSQKFSTALKNGVTAIIFFSISTFATVAPASTSAVRVETNVTQSNDTVEFTFFIYNDNATDTLYTGSLLITITGSWALCDSGKAITTTVPTITDTSIHPSVAPYVLQNKGIFQFVYNFHTHNRLILLPNSITEVGSAILKVAYGSQPCHPGILYQTPNSPSHIAIATTQTNSLSFILDYYKFFLTEP